MYIHLIRYIGLYGMLLICSVEDARDRRVSLPVILAGAAVGIITQIVSRDARTTDLIGGVLVGAALIAVSLLSRGAVGSGDGALMAATGIYLGLAANLLLLWLATLVCGMIGLACVIRGRGAGRRAEIKKQKIPYVPVAACVCAILSLLSYLTGEGL